MALSQAEFNRLVTDHGLDENAVARLRSMWPEIHFTYCSDDDVCGPAPVRESDGFSIYLIDSRDHCLAFTSDPDIATAATITSTTGTATTVATTTTTANVVYVDGGGDETGLDEWSQVKGRRHPGSTTTHDRDT